MQGLYQHNLPKDIKLFLAKPNKKIIAPLKFALQRTLKWNENAPNEINFSLPYEISVDHKMEKYEPVELLKEKFLIKAISNEYEEWFIVSSYGKSSDDTDIMNVSCRSLESSFEKKKLINFERKSYNVTMLLNDILPGTGFKIGYINPNLNLKYREFDITSTSKLSFIYEDMATTFEALVVFDTIAMTVNFYEKNELSEYKGFIINENRYLIDIEESIDSSEIVTRLHITGSDGLGIQSVNPTGQRYIDDFSYFLYPFEVDDKGKITKSSYFMEDDLALALTRYNQYVSNRKDDFRNLLDEKSKQQEKLSSLQNKLFELETDLQTVLDSIKWMKEEGLNVDSQNKERKDNNQKVSDQKQKIKAVEDEIKLIDDKISKLKKDLDISNHLSPALLDQLEYFIHEDEWDDNNKIDPNDLYESGIEKLKEINAPPINIQTSLANFLNDTNAKDDWKRMHLSDITRIQHRRIGIDAKARISAIIIDFDSPSIDLEISNLPELNSRENELKSFFYRIHKVDTDYSKRKIDYERVANNFNLRNDRVKETPASPIIESNAMSHKRNDDGSVDITVKWDFPDFLNTEKNKHNIDGFMLYFYSDTTPDYYQFSTQMTNEQITTVPYASRSFVFPSLPANLYYTIGVRAYRRVDPDINRDSILMSPIIRFNDSRNLANQITQAETANILSSTLPTPPSSITSLGNIVSDEESESPAYKPEKTVNINGRMNGKNYSVQNDEPSEPITGDIWVSIEEGKMRVWNGENWTGDKSLDDLEEGIENANDQISEYEKALRKKIEDAMREVDQAMERVDSEMDRIENEVIPDVEKAIEETFIPKQDTPPENIPPSGLWWDTSQEPPRIMCWDEESESWVVLAPNLEEIDEIIDSIVESAKQEFKQYTDEEIEAMRNIIQESLEERTSQLNEKVTELLQRANGLDDKVILIDNELDDQRNRVSQIVEDVSNKANIEWVDEQLSLRANGITQSPTPPENPKENELWLDISTIPNVLKRWAGEVWEKASPTEANELGAYTFEQVDGALNSKVSNDTYNIDKDGFVERFETNELSISTLAGELEFKADQAILDTVSDTVESHSTLLSIQAGLIESKVDSDYVDGELDEIRSYASSIEQTAQRVDTSLSSLIESHDELGKDVEKNTTDISIQAGLIEAKLDSTTYNRDKNDLLTSIEQNTLDIQATAKGLEAKAESTRVDEIAGTVEGHSTEIELLATGLSSRVDETFVRDAINGIEIGGRNLYEGTIDEWQFVNLSDNWNLYPNGAGYYIDVEPNQEYTASVYYRNVTGQTMGLRIFWRTPDTSQNESTNSEEFVTPEQGEGFAKITRKAPSDAIGARVVLRRFANSGTTTFEYKELQFERGNKNTSWGPASQDILSVQEHHNTLISQNSRDISLQAESIVNLDGLISDAQASINIMSDEINERVEKTIFNNESDYLRQSIAETRNFAEGIEQTVSSIQVGGSNLVTNGGFENGDFGWQYSSSRVTIVNDSKTGSKSLNFSAGTTSVSLINNIPVTPGNKYEFTAWVKTHSGANGTSNNQKLRIGKADGSLISGVGLSFDGARIEWTKLSSIWTADVNEITVSIVANHSQGWVRWDDISIIDVTDRENTDQRMTIAESSITQLSNQIITKVEQDGIISSINQTPESIGINAALLDFSGLAKFEPFSKNYYQSTTIANGNGGKWYRIARNAGSRAHAKFILRDTTSSQHSTAVFEAGVNYNRNPYINLTSYGLYASVSFSQVRILTNSTYDDVYLEVYINNNARDQSLAYWITENIQNSGWIGVNWTNGSIPSGYSSFNRSIDSENVVQGTVDKWKYGNTTLINGGEIYTNTITANQINVNQVFGNSAVIAKIQSDSVLTANLSATKITTGTLNAGQVSVVNLSASSIISGTLDASKVNVRNLNASEIKTGILSAIDIEGINITGSTFRSANGQDIMSVTSGSIKLSQGNGRYVEINPNGIYGYTGSNTPVFQADSTIVTSAALGTSNTNVYLAPMSDGEARIVDYNDIPGDGLVGSYRYLRLRASGFLGNYLNVNPAVPGGATNVYLRPLSGGEARITLSESTTNYQHLRADWAYVNRIIPNALQSNQSHMYVSTLNDGELRIVNNESTTVYRAVRAAGYYGEYIDTPSHNLYTRTASGGELRVTLRGSTTNYQNFRADWLYGNRLIVNGLQGSNNHLYIGTVNGGEVRAVHNETDDNYRPVRASSFPTGTSLRENKTDIEVFDDDALSVIRKANPYLYRLKNDEYKEQKQLGLMVDETPRVLHGEAGDSMEMYALNTFLWRGIQQLDTKLDEDIDWQRKENQALKDRVTKLEGEIKELKEKLG